MTMKKNFEIIKYINTDFENAEVTLKNLTWNEALHYLKKCYEWATSDEYRYTIAIRKIGDTEPYSIEYTRCLYSKFYN